MGVYEVIIELNTPFALQSRKPHYSPLCFDSILAWLAALKKGCVGPPRAEEFQDFDLPLRRVGKKHRFYKASAVWVDSPCEVGMFPWVRSNDWQDEAFKFAKPNKKGEKPFAKGVHPGSGPFRLQRQSVMLIAAPRVRFWFDGDRKAVENLLEGLTHIGARTHAGYGRIADIAVRPSEHDFTLFGPDGSPARPLPVDEVECRVPAHKAFCGYTYPYWHPQNWTLCYIPPLERWIPLGELKKVQIPKGKKTENAELEV